MQTTLRHWRWLGEGRGRLVGGGDAVVFRGVGVGSRCCEFNAAADEEASGAAAARSKENVIAIR